ncbi:MAG TPA: hypothetical protein VKZ53_31100 [Candidatus Angelobacter sp.]|nr:hypothetical protein [Candidatus Angelobacter sp.]
MVTNMTVDDFSRGDNGSQPVPEASTDSKTENAAGARKRYQLHFWVGEKEYDILRRLADSQDEPMARVLRRLIRRANLLSPEVE